MSTGNLISDAIGSIKSSGAGVIEEGSQDSFVTSSESSEDSGVRTDLEADDVVSNTESEDSSDKDEVATETDSSSKSVPTPKTSSKEMITVTDEAGKKRTIEIDYQNRDAIKKAVSLAHGARKWQAERDNAIQNAKQLEQKMSETQRTLNALEKAYAEGGEAGVLDLLAGKQGAHKEWAQRTLERERLAKEDPEAYQQLLKDERLVKLEREIEKEREARESDKKKIQQEREQAELASLESQVHPTFEKYRFDGRLGDADDEALFDEILWNQALKQLEPYEEKGLLTRQVIDKEFSNVAAKLRKRMGTQVEKKVAKVVEQKKQDATSNAQAATVSAYRQGGVKKEASDLIQSGNLKGLFSNWGKYSKAFK